MKIKYFGHASFYLRFKKAKLITDPFDPKMVGFSFPRKEADIVTISHGHNDHNRADLVKGEPLVIDLPGEYEKKGVKIKGFLTYHDKQKGAERGENVIYKIEGDDVSLLHLGDLGHVLSDSLVEEVGEVDVLFIPVGGFYTIGPEEAVQNINKLEPKIIVPMHYNHEKLNQQVFGKLAPLERFLESIGKEAQRVDELEISKENLADKEKEVVVLNLG